MKKYCFSLLICLLGSCVSLYAQTITTLQSGVNTSIRGLSVVNDSVAWISGSNGYTSKTINGGKTWTWKQLAGYEKLDFRDIEAFSNSRAILVSAGTPAVVLLTSNGGADWKEVYRNESKEIFLDGMDFWDENRGIIYGDPINGRMQLLETLNGGQTWEDISGNLPVKLAEGEASFAASGTAIRTGKPGNVWIATGGSQSRIFKSSNYGASWKVYDCPIIQGKNSTGPFSVAFHKSRRGIAAGGDYLADTLRNNNLVLTKNGGKSWTKALVNPFGYRSAVEYISKSFLVATGTSGTDISADGGKTWKNISSEGFNSVRKAKHGNFTLLAGSNGRINSLSLK